MLFYDSPKDQYIADLDEKKGNRYKGFRKPAEFLLDSRRWKCSSASKKIMGFCFAIIPNET